MSERRLAAILAADVVGYSRMIAADEAGTLARLRGARRGVVDPPVAEFKGRVFKVMGDGLLAEFPSAVQALRCAIAIQQRLREGDGLQVRIGLHQGDVVAEGGDLLGDGVNVAARLEALAEPGGICISARVREDAAGKMPLDLEDIGSPPLKNIAQPVHVFRVHLDPPERPTLALPDKPSLAVLPFQNLSGDPEQEYFAEGMVEDITTALSRIGRLFAIARNASFTYCCPAVGTIHHHLVRLNRMDEARALARTILAEEPGLTLAFARRTHRGCTPAFVERRIAALRAAGIPQ
jgi:adenylate cyclase